VHFARDAGRFQDVVEQLAGFARARGRVCAHGPALP
jgi:hypothetical protein